MSRDIWVTSDTHFNHANILNFRAEDGSWIRGEKFATVEHMNEVIIENWNKVVKPGDKVYHLGDVFFGSKEEFKKLWPRLNGRKRLIVGNHDDIKFLSQGAFFQKVDMWRIFEEFNIILSHVPLHDTAISYRHVLYNVHGHIHERPAPTDRHICVCVEQTNYTPVNIEELRRDNLE